MCDGYISEFSPIAELSKIEVKPNEVLVIKVNTDKINIDKANEIFRNIRKEFPINTNMIGIPVGIDLEMEVIDNMIRQLEEMKNGILH